MRSSQLAIAALLMGAAAAAAAPASDEAATRKVVRDYARCVVKKRADRASAAIMTDSSNDMIERQFSSLIDSECLGAVAGSAQLKFGGDSFRYALADALVSAQFAKQATASFSDRLPLAHLPSPDRAAFDAALAQAKGKRQRDAMQKQFDRQQAVAWLSRYGECIVRQEPEKARLWLLTEPDKPEEISRINDLRPAFSQCLGEGTMKFNRTTMRGTVAINYYRLAMATHVPGSTQ